MIIIFEMSGSSNVIPKRWQNSLLNKLSKNTKTNKLVWTAFGKLSFVTCVVTNSNGL